MPYTVYFVFLVLILVVSICSLIVLMIMSSKKIQESESENHLAEMLSHKFPHYYVTYLCTKTNKAKVYKGVYIDTWDEAGPSEDDLSYLRSEILAANPEFNDCIILFFDKLKG